MTNEEDDDQNRKEVHADGTNARTELEGTRTAEIEEQCTVGSVKRGPRSRAIVFLPVTHLSEW